MTEQCVSDHKERKIKVGADGKHVVILNQKCETFKVYQVDGCLIVDGKRADKIVRSPKAEDVVIEFKGADIERAAKQIDATARFWISEERGAKPIHGCIVSTYTPAFNATIQRARLSFRKKYGGNLALKKPSREYAFSTLIS